MEPRMSQPIGRRGPSDFLEIRRPDSSGTALGLSAGLGTSIAVRASRPIRLTGGRGSGLSGFRSENCNHFEEVGSTNSGSAGEGASLPMRSETARDEISPVRSHEQYGRDSRGDAFLGSGLQVQGLETGHPPRRRSRSGQEAGDRGGGGERIPRQRRGEAPSAESRERPGGPAGGTGETGQGVERAY